MTIQVNASLYKATRYLPILDFNFETYTQLYRKNIKSLTKFLTYEYTVGCVEDAEDLAQEIFVALWIKYFDCAEPRPVSELFPFTPHKFCEMIWQKTGNRISKAENQKEFAESNLVLDVDDETADWINLMEDTNPFTSSPELACRFAELKGKICNTFTDPVVLDIFISRINGEEHNDICAKLGIPRRSYFRLFGHNRPKFDALVKESFDLSDL